MKVKHDKSKHLQYQSTERQAAEDANPTQREENWLMFSIANTLKFFQCLLTYSHANGQIYMVRIRR